MLLRCLWFGFFQRHFFLYICHLLWHYSFFTVSSKESNGKKEQKTQGFEWNGWWWWHVWWGWLRSEISYYIKWWCNCNVMFFCCMASGTRPISLFLSLLASDYWLTDEQSVQYMQCSGNNKCNKRCNHFNYFMSCCSLALPPHV